jgi:hypothetical protein
VGPLTKNPGYGGSGVSAPAGLRIEARMAYYGCKRSAFSFSAVSFMNQDNWFYYSSKLIVIDAV